MHLVNSAREVIVKGTSQLVHMCACVRVCVCTRVCVCMHVRACMCPNNTDISTTCNTNMKGFLTIFSFQRLFLNTFC